MNDLYYPHDLGLNDFPHEEKTVTINMISWMYDPDQETYCLGDLDCRYKYNHRVGALDYSAAVSSDPSAVSVAGVSFHLLTLRWEQTGKDAVITVTAKDPDGAIAYVYFDAYVYNNAPEFILDQFPAQELEVCKSIDIDLSQYFTDQDGDEIAYVVSPDASDSYEHVARGSVSGSVLTINALDDGETEMRVTAFNPHAYEDPERAPYSTEYCINPSCGSNSSSAEEFDITVTGEKECEGRAPRKIEGGPALSLTVPPGGETTVRLTDYIEDPDGGALVFTPGALPLGITVTRNAPSGPLRRREA